MKGIKGTVGPWPLYAFKVIALLNANLVTYCTTAQWRRRVALVSYTDKKKCCKNTEFSVLFKQCIFQNVFLIQHPGNFSKTGHLRVDIIRPPSAISNTRSCRRQARLSISCWHPRAAALGCGSAEKLRPDLLSSTTNYHIQSLPLRPPPFPLPRPLTCLIKLHPGL